MAMLTIEGTDVHDRTGIFLDLVTGYFEPSQVRGSDTIVPALTGRITRNRVRDTRRIVLSGYVTGTSAADFSSNASALGALIAPISEVTIAIADGYLGIGGSASIVCRCVNWITGDPLYAVVYQSWSIEFEAITPEWS